jgi:hypothetical protein
LAADRAAGQFLGWFQLRPPQKRRRDRLTHIRTCFDDEQPSMALTRDTWSIN